jgi:hypothetical protein
LKILNIENLFYPSRSSSHLHSQSKWGHRRHQNAGENAAAIMYYLVHIASRPDWSYCSRLQSVICFTPRKCKRCRDNLDNKKESYWYWTSRPHHVKNHVFFQIRGEWGKNNVSLLAPSSFVDSKGIVTLLAYRIVWL